MEKTQEYLEKIVEKENICYLEDLVALSGLTKEEVKQIFVGNIRGYNRIAAKMRKNKNKNKL